MASRDGGAIFQPPRGRPSKVTKPSAAPRRRRPDTVPNQDPNLDQAFVGGSTGTGDGSADGDGQPDLEPPQPPPSHEHDPSPHHHDAHQQPHHPHADDESKYHDPSQLDHHAAFDPEGAAAAAAAAAQAQQQQHQQHQQQDPQLDLGAAATILSGGPGAMGLNPHEHSDLAQHLGEGGESLGGGGGGGGGMGQATEEVARQSGYDNVMIESALAKRLAREPGMRLASQRRPEQTLNLQRRSNVEALFAHIAGEVAVVPCKNCHKGHGPWTSCVIVDGQMCGSCANCWFNASGARCSFHETRNPPTHAPVLGAPETGFQLHTVPPIAAGGFNYASVSSAPVDPVVKYTVDRAMHDLRTADKRTRHMLMIEVAAKQLAYNILQYEEHQAQEEHQQAAQQHAQQQQHPHAPPPGQPPQAVPDGSLMDEDPDAP